MISITGELYGIGGASGSDASIDLMVSGGALIEVRGLSHAHCRALAPAMFKRVTLTIEGAAEGKGVRDGA